MLPLIAMLAAQDPTKLAARRGVGLIAMVAIISFGLVFALALVVVLRRGRRARDLASGRTPPDAHAELDAWSEAGRRVDPDEGDEFIAGYDTGEFGPPDGETRP